MNIIDVREGKGSEHDFKMYKDRGGKSLHKTIRIDAVLGIEKLHVNNRIPKKPSKKHKLSKGEKGFNKLLARKRVVLST